MHDAITLGVPVLAIFFGILLNHRGLSELKADLKGDLASQKIDLKSDIGRLEAKIDRLHADIVQINRDLGRHDARLEALEGNRA